MELLSIKDAIDLYQSQVKITNDLWTYLGTVSLAVLGFTIGSEKATRTGREIAMIVAGYAIFALGGNLPALRMAYAELAKLSALVDSVMQAPGGTLPALNLHVYPVHMVTIYHVAIVVAVCAAMIMYWHARHSVSTPPARQLDI